MTTLFHDVRLLDLDQPSGMTAPCDLRVTGDRIAAIGPDLPSDGAEVIPGHGRLLAPGLVNGHFHSSVNHMKGRLPGLPLEIFMLYESPALEGLRPTPREAWLRTMLGAIEMLRGGVTAVQDDLFLVPAPTPEIVDAVCQAYLDAGLRATVALDEPELAETDKLPFLADLLPPDLRATLSRPPAAKRADLLALYDHLIRTWHGREGRIGAAVSCSAPQRVGPAYFADLDALSRRHDLPFYAHMLETKTQRVLGQTRNKCSLVRHTADLGLLSDRMNVIHAIWVDAHDLDLIAEAGAVIAHNPVSNLRLGSGVMPFRAIRDRGIPVCLGVDEAIADDSVSLWGVMKLAGMIHNLSGADYGRWPQAREILACATTGGGRAMRRDLGRIAVGALADLILIDLDTLPFTPLNDLPRQLVHCETGTSVRLAMVAGRIVVRDGRVTTVDEAAILAEARALFAARAPTLEAAARAMDARLPYYRAMYDRAMAADVGMERRLEALA